MPGAAVNRFTAGSQRSINCLKTPLQLVPVLPDHLDPVQMLPQD